MSIKALPKGINIIPLPTPFPVGPVNVILMEDSPITLVDCGPNTAAARAALEQALASRGLSLASIQALVLTHHHTDHIGMAGWIKEHSQADVISHPKSAAVISGSDGEARRKFIAACFRRSGVPEEVVGTVGEFYRTFRTLESPSRVNKLVQDGDELMLGGLAWRVVETPGHTSGSICLVNSADKILISGDHLIGHISSNAVLESVTPGSDKPQRSLPAYLKSLRKTAEFELDLVLPGHGEIITDHRLLIARRIELCRHRQDQIAALIKGRPMNAYQISTELFPGLDNHSLFLGISEVIGFLQLLEDEGCLTHSERGGVDFFEA